MGLWRTSTTAALIEKRAHPGRVLLVPFEMLVTNTRAAMETVTSFLGLDVPEIALVPTFNGSRIKAHSSFAVRDYGVLHEPVERASMLEPALAQQIDELCGDLYDVALQGCRSPTSASASTT
jgi:hypothetical protein